MKEIKDAIERVEQNTIKLDTRLDKIELQQVENNTDLKHHMRRTDLNENRIAKVEYWLLGMLASLLLFSMGLAAKLLS
jgi:hypothetical protein